MFKWELIAEVSDRTGYTKVETEAVLDETLQIMAEKLAAGEKVQLTGFGRFDVHERKERQGRNPATGQSVTVPPTKILKFKTGKRLKEAVRGKV